MNKGNFLKKTFINVDELEKILKENEDIKKAGTLEELTNVLKKYEKTTHEAVRLQPYWWTSEIQNKREECNKLNREITRAKTKGLQKDRDHELKTKRKELKQLIYKSKRTCWKLLVDEAQDDIWGQAYKIAYRKLSGNLPYQLSTEKKIEYITELFPTNNNPRKQKIRRTDNIRKFTKEEMENAGKALKSGKAPGPDGIPPEIIKLLIKNIPETLLAIMNNILKKQKIPKKFKEAKVILIWKSGKSPETATSFRTICLINTLAKLFELLIKLRLECEVNDRKGLHERQFGFRKGKSTLKALEWIKKRVENTPKRWLIIITIDVRNAFNSLSWEKTIKALKDMKISKYLVNLIQSYLSERKLIITNKNRIGMSAGVPQGSVLGPLLWNIAYDGVLNLELETGANTLAYADDLALCVEADNIAELTQITNISLRKIEEWFKNNELKIAYHKSEAILLKGNKCHQEFRIKLGNEEIALSKSIKYLGIHHDRWGLYGEHVKRTSEKAKEQIKNLAKIMPNIGGPDSQKRLLLSNVVHSTLLYGAPIWQKALKVRNYREKLEQVQRQVMIRVAMAYKTAATKGLSVITGIMPIHLQIEKRTMEYYEENKNKENMDIIYQTTMNKWEKEWEDEHNVAQWTKTLIPKIKTWYECKHRKTDHYLTQFLTGHGVFQNYLHRIGKSNDANCKYCEKSDSAEHTAFECARWERQRSCLNSKLGQNITKENLTDLMCKKENQWKIVHEYIKNIIKQKMHEEHIEENHTNAEQLLSGPN